MSTHPLPFPLPVDPRFQVATALELLGAGHPCLLSLKPPSAVFQVAFCELFPFYFLAAFPSPVLHRCVLESPLHAE